MASSIDSTAQQRALDALGKFAERLRDLPPSAVRAVGTNSLRVAVNAPEFIERAEKVLGFPIEVIAGREEARLIYQGVAHGLPQTDDNLLVMDIGGGCTQFIIGHGLERFKPGKSVYGLRQLQQPFLLDRENLPAQSGERQN